MDTEEKKELNIDEKTPGKKAKKEIEAKREELKESFKKVFYRTTAGEFKMPFNIAWKNFEILSERRGGILPKETEKITSFCKLIRKEYFKSKGLDVLIMDSNGNPRLSMTLEENPHFLRENPILAENVDIKNAVENRIIEQKMRDLMLAESMEDFFNKLGLLDEEEKNDIFQKILSEEIKQTREEKDEYNRISQVAKARPLTEEEKETIYNNKLKAGIRKVSEKFDKKEELNPEDKLRIFDYATQFIYSDSEEEKKEMILILSTVMSREEIEQFNVSPSVFYKYVLSRINSLTDGSYKNLKEFKEARKELAIEEFKKEHDISIDFTIEDSNLDLDLDLFENNKGYFRINEGNIKSKLKTPMEKRILNTIKNIDLSKDENALMFVKLYLDCRKENVFLNDGVKSGYSFSRDESQIEKLNEIKNVLEAVIFARENAGIFGDYIDVNSRGERVIDEEKIEDNIENIKDVYKTIRSDVTAYIVRKGDLEKLRLDQSFDRAEKKIESEEIINNNLLSQFVEKKKAYEESEDSYAKKEINLELLEIERKLMKVKDYTLFFIGGRFDYDAFQNYKINQAELEKNRDEKLENIIKEFSKVSYRKYSTVGQNNEESDIRRRKAIFDKLYPGENFEKYNKMYKEYIEELSEKTAIENVYRPFLKGSKLDDMTDIKKDRFISSLGYLYVSKNPEIRKFAEEMIKNTFPNIECGEDGKIDEKEFATIYTSFQRNGIGLDEAKESMERKVSIPLARKKKIDFSKIDLDIDLKKINLHLERVNKEKSRRSPAKFLSRYDDEEMKTISKVKDLDLSDSSNVDAIIMILAKFESDGKRLSTEYAALRDFVYTSQNRKYFAQYLEKSKLKTKRIPIIADPDKVNIDIIKKFGLEEDIEIGRIYEVKSKFEKEIKYQEVKSVLSLVYTYANDPEILKKSLKKLGLWEHEALNVFKKGKTLNVERLSKLSDKMSDYMQNNDAKENLVEILAKNFTTKDAMVEYTNNFDVFAEESYKVIKDITEKKRGVTEEERKADYDARMERAKKEKELTEEEYYARRPVGTEEDIRRLEERETWRKQSEEQRYESESKTQESDEQKPISDNEVEQFSALQQDKVVEIKIYIPKEKKIDEVLDFQSEDLGGTSSIAVEDINADAVEESKSLIVKEKENPILSWMKKAINAFKKAFKARGTEKEEPAMATIKERPRELSFDERYGGYSSVLDFQKQPITKKSNSISGKSNSIEDEEVDKN